MAFVGGSAPGGTGFRMTDRKLSGGRRRTDAVAAAAFLSPAMIFFTIFVIVPALGGLGLSFFDWNLFNDPTFVGLDNVSRLFSDEEVWQSLLVSLTFIVLGVVPTTVIGFMLAVIASSARPVMSSLRVLYFAPLVVSSAVSAVLWSNLYQHDYGLLNQLLALVGVKGPNWLTDLAFAQPALVVVLIWSSLPIVIILYIAAIQRVPEDLYAAAALDGAGKWRQLWSITWPNVLPTSLVIIVIMILTFLGGTLELALLMTGGGPLGRTTSLALYAYQVAFQQHEMGYASALSLFQLILIIAIFLVGRGVVRVWKARH